MRPERLPLVHAAIPALIMVALLGGPSQMLGDSMLGQALAGLWWQLPFMFGLTLAAAGIARRAGDSLHCPGCEYEFTFAEAEAPVRCPECGTGWLGRLKKGRRVKSMRLAAAGVGVAAGGLLLG